jgi:molybdopterin-guanine dinucleotide biosynthesis protein A
MANVAFQARPLPLAPLRVCCLGGGLSRRMGQDKALLRHPEGGTWLERTLLLLADLDRPLTLVSHHPSHQQVAMGLAERGGWGDRLERLVEPEPREGPLLALARLMEHHPNQRLLLCPVDMPWLRPATLAALVAAPADATAILVAHDGERQQPLLGLYPSDRHHRAAIGAATAAGERRLQGWIATVGCQELELPPESLRNANGPADAAPLWGETPRAEERP